MFMWMWTCTCGYTKRPEVSVRCLPQWLSIFFALPWCRSCVLFLRFIHFYLMDTACMYARVACACSTHEGQKRVLELELQTEPPCMWVLRIELGSTGKLVGVPDHRAISCLSILFFETRSPPWTWCSVTSLTGHHNPLFPQHWDYRSPMPQLVFNVGSGWRPEFVVLITTLYRMSHHPPSLLDAILISTCLVQSLLQHKCPQSL